MSILSRSRLWIAVYRESNGNIKMQTFNSDDQILKNVASYALGEDSRQLQRVFTIDESGTVKHFEVVYEHGIFKTKPLPEEEKSRQEYHDKLVP